MPRKAVQPSLSERQAAPGGVGAVDRALSLLDVFTLEQPRLTLAELAVGSEQYKSTVSRLLASLLHAHVVERHADGRFSLGSAIPRLQAVYSASVSIETIVLPALRQLVRTTRETASYHVRQGAQRLCLFGVDSPQTIRDHTQVGTLWPLESGAAGQVFTACSVPFASRAAWVSENQFVLAAADVLPEVAAIAAPVFDASGTLSGVIALTMPAMRFTASHGPHVRDAANGMTASLGGSCPASK